MKVRKLINNLLEICVDQGVSIHEVDVLIRRDDDSDVHELNFVEEDLFDADTNKILETIVVKHRSDESSPEDPMEPADHLKESEDLILKLTMQNANMRDRLIELGDARIQPTFSVGDDGEPMI